jgi:hypothetical protein
MHRNYLALVIVGGLLAASTADAQCRGGGGGQGTTGTTTGTTTGVTTGTTGTGTTAQVLRGPGSLAFDLMAQQMLAQQIAQQRMLLAMQQQKVREEKLAARKYRADHTRAQVAESRARTRAALAAQAGLTAPTTPGKALLAYQPARR